MTISVGAVPVPEHEVPDWLEGVRRRLGEPLRLTSSESALLHEVLAPLIGDLTATSGVIPYVAEFQWDLEPGAITALIGQPHHAQGIRVQVDLPAGERLVDLADQVQEWEIEALWLERGQATWPECPEHARSHPLSARLDGQGTAVWQCPKTGHALCAIGALGH